MFLMHMVLALVNITWYSIWAQSHICRSFGILAQQLALTLSLGADSWYWLPSTPGAVPTKDSLPYA